LAVVAVSAVGGSDGDVAPILCADVSNNGNFVIAGGSNSSVTKIAVSNKAPVTRVDECEHQAGLMEVAGKEAVSACISTKEMRPLKDSEIFTSFFASCTVPKMNISTRAAVSQQGHPQTT
jgi:hypothetical protein